jgi:RsmE family RNA methyltransferase
MNLILLKQNDFISVNRARLTQRRYLHARDILRVTSGQTLRVGLLDGNIGYGTVLSIGNSCLEIEVQLDKPAPQPIPATIILALPRPKVFKRVLQGITSMGIKRVVLINTWRVDKSYWQSPALAPEAIHEQLILGLEQARDTILPTVQLERRFKPFVEDRLPAITAGTCGLVAHPGSSQPCPANITGSVTLAIGPEGGFTEYEVEKLVAAGLAPTHLGDRPLRVETAVPAFIGRLQPCL